MSYLQVSNDCQRRTKHQSCACISCFLTLGLTALCFLCCKTPLLGTDVFGLLVGGDITPTTTTFTIPLEFLLPPSPSSLRQISSSFPLGYDPVTMSITGQANGSVLFTATLDAAGSYSFNFEAIVGLGYDGPTIPGSLTISGLWVGPNGEQMPVSDTITNPGNNEVLYPLTFTPFIVTIHRKQLPAIVTFSLTDSVTLSTLPPSDVSLTFGGLSTLLPLATPATISVNKFK